MYRHPNLGVLKTLVKGQQICSRSASLNPAATLIRQTTSIRQSTYRDVDINGLAHERRTTFIGLGKTGLAKLWPLILLGCAVLLWAVSLIDVDLRAMNDTGLVSVLPLTFYGSFGLLTLSFIFLAHRPQGRAAILLLHLVALIVMIHGTPVILYDTLRYSWAWKHLGIVDYIQRNGAVDPNISALNVYHNWPGFFATSAFLTEVAGFKSALSLAKWAPVFFNLLNLGALLLIFKSLIRDQRVVWLGLWFFFLTNWVGQEYFSPQAISYFLYLVILGICFRWLRVPAATTSSKKRSRMFAWMPVRVQTAFTRSESTEALIPETRPWQRTAMMALAILLSAVIVFTHQLTPFMAIIGLGLLVVFQRLSALTLPILIAVMMIAWASYPAATFVGDNIGGLAQSVGRLWSNADSNLVGLSQVSSGQAFVVKASRVLTAFVGILAILGGMRRIFHGYWDLSAALLIIAPVLFLGLNSYGGEILFRVYLFALPFMAFFIATLLLPDSTAGKSLKMKGIGLLLSIALLSGFLIAYYGNERQYYFTQNEVDAAEYLYSSAPPNSLLIEGSRNYPTQFRNYENFTYVPIDREDPEDILNFIDHPVETLSRWMSNDDYAASYFIVTRSQKAATNSLGTLPPGSLDDVEAAISQSPNFDVIYSNMDANIYVLKDSNELGRHQ